MVRASPNDENAAVCTICRELGLGEVAPALLKAAHHTTFLIPSHGIVARVQSSEPIDVAKRRADREIAVARYLANRDAPAVAPLDARLAGPHVIASSVVTLWHYVDHQRTADDADAPLAAAALADVHRGLLDYEGELPPYTQTLDRCWQMLAHGIPRDALSDDDRDVLKTHYLRLRREVETTASGWVPLHGDAHLGNLLVGRHGLVWTDFEDACVGPREYDIASLPSAVWRHFVSADQALIGRYADLKNVCVAVWCWADIARNEEVRDAAEYHLNRVREFPL